MTSISLAPSFASPAVARLKPQLALLGLLLAEILWLTVTLDTQPLARIPSYGATLIGWSPQYLRLGVTIFLLMLLFGRTAFLAAISTLHRTATPTARLPYLAVHGVALLGFFFVSRTLFAAGPSVAAHDGLWAIAWSISGALTFGSWALAMFPWRHWVEVAREQRAVIASGLAAGTLVWASGFITEAFWQPLARYTFAIVTWLLQVFYTDVIVRPEKLVVGTSTFSVNIAPSCSGYEGVGLILAFLGIYLYLLRKDLRFPAAFILLPIGALTIWVLNAVRIFALDRDGNISVARNRPRWLPLPGWLDRVQCRRPGIRRADQPRRVLRA